MFLIEQLYQNARQLRALHIPPKLMRLVLGRGRVDPVIIIITTMAAAYARFASWDYIALQGSLIRVYMFHTDLFFV